MIQILNKLRLVEVLTLHCGPSQLDVTPYYECVGLEENIVLDPDNDQYETFEIFVAIMLHLHETLINEDEFEMAKLIMKTYWHQYKQMKKETDAGADEDTMWWLHFADEYFNQTIQSQLKKYTA